MSPQSPDHTSSPDKLVPFRWPSAWTDPALLRLFADSPINCVLFESLGSAGSVVEPARRAGLAVLEWNSLGAAPLDEIQWKSAAPQTVITGLVWPRIKMSAKATAEIEAGPTGAPWIDSNTWVARLAAVRAPHRPVWLSFEPAKDDPVPGEAEYSIAIADSAASGARWIVSLDESLRKGLPIGNAYAGKIWRSILSALAFFEKHRDWNSWDRSGPVGILSSYAGNDQFMGQELLNLAARRNLLYRVLDRLTPNSQKLDGLRAVLYLDSDMPNAELKAKLDEFARAGGLLIVPRSVAAQFVGEKSVPCQVAGYDVRSFGRGRVAASTRDWDDPFFLAADLHNLVGRRNDPVLLFNGQSLWEHYSTPAGGRAALLQLVSFTSRPKESVSMIPARPWRSAAFYTLGSATPATLEPVRVQGRPEFHLPAFSYYGALEFRS
jgi:hypothetical protein